MWHRDIYHSADLIYWVCVCGGCGGGGRCAGWYNVREETFVTENEAKLSNYLDPVSREYRINTACVLMRP